VLLAALLAGQIYPDDPMDMVARANLWPGVDPNYPLGTDMLGRDIAAGIVHAARVSLSIGFIAAGIAVLIGTLVGILSGYFGGVVDDALMRTTELFQTLPTFLFAIVLVVILSPSVWSITLAIGVTSWPQVARLVRAEAMRIRASDYVAAAQTFGRSHAGILLAHVLPNSLYPVVVVASILVANAVLTEASLSFLGLGDPRVVSWGSMIGAGREALRTGWYMTALPGLAVFVTVMGFALLGNGLNDLLNPRASG
jgi:peptide/nickel transport system permease protein